MITLQIDEAEYEMIHEALNHRWTFQIKLSVINRNWHPKQLKFMNAKRLEERNDALRKKHSDLADKLHHLIFKLDKQANP